MVKISPKKEKRVKGKIRRVFKKQGRKESIAKLVKAWKRICKSEKISLPELTELVEQVDKKETI